MRRPLIVFAFAFALVAGAWIWNVVAYAGDEESTPNWLLAIWFLAWGILALAILWTIVRFVRTRGRAQSGGTVG